MIESYFFRIAGATQPLQLSALSFWLLVPSVRLTRGYSCLTPLCGFPSSRVPFDPSGGSRRRLSVKATLRNALQTAECGGANVACYISAIRRSGRDGPALRVRRSTSLLLHNRRCIHAARRARKRERGWRIQDRAAMNRSRRRYASCHCRFPASARFCCQLRASYWTWPCGGILLWALLYSLKLVEWDLDPHTDATTGRLIHPFGGGICLMINLSGCGIATFPT